MGDLTPCSHVITIKKEHAPTMNYSNLNTIRRISTIPNLSLINKIPESLAKQSMDVSLSNLRKAMLPELPMASMIPILSRLPEETTESLRRLNNPMGLNIQRQMGLLSISNTLEAQLKKVFRSTTLAYAPSISLDRKFKASLYQPLVVANPVITSVAWSALGSMGMSNATIFNMANITNLDLSLAKSYANSSLSFRIEENIEPTYFLLHKTNSSPKLEVPQAIEFRKTNKDSSSAQFDSSLTIMGMLSRKAKAEIIKRQKSEFAKLYSMLEKKIEYTERQNKKIGIEVWLVSSACSILFDTIYENLPFGFIIVVFKIALSTITGYPIV